jgi:hypothetical protein
MAINYRHDFHAFSASRRPNLGPASFRHRKRRIDEALFFIQRAAVAKLIGDIRQNTPQNLVAAPRLKAPMHGFVVRITLRKHVPLRACVENPQNGFQHAPGRDRFAPRTTIGNLLFRKMIPDTFPLLVCEPNHPTFIPDRLRPAILR